MHFSLKSPTMGQLSCKNCLFLMSTVLQIRSCQILNFCFVLDICHGHVWKFYQLLLISTFSMSNWDTLVQILAHNSHNKYGFQAIDRVRNFMLTLLCVFIWSGVYVECGWGWTPLPTHHLFGWMVLSLWFSKSERDSCINDLNLK